MGNELATYGSFPSWLSCLWRWCTSIALCCTWTSKCFWENCWSTMGSGWGCSPPSPLPQSGLLSNGGICISSYLLIGSCKSYLAIIAAGQHVLTWCVIVRQQLRAPLTQHFYSSFFESFRRSIICAVFDFRFVFRASVANAVPHATSIACRHLTRLGEKRKVELIKSDVKWIN